MSSLDKSVKGCIHFAQSFSFRNTNHCQAMLYEKLLYFFKQGFDFNCQVDVLQLIERAVLEGDNMDRLLNTN